MKMSFSFGTVSNPAKWTAETPNLYTLQLTLKDERGNIIESTSSKIGFRKIEITDGQLLVNGKKVMIKGINLHEFNTNTGQVVNEEIMMRNIQLMKELNINAVRTSHYPQPPLWYKLCDQYGIYLVDEANLESHGLGYGPDNVSNSPEWKAQHMDRMIRLVERDKNHPSVITWSLGNEASNGKAFFAMYDWAKERDPSRPVQYEQAYQRDRNTDIIAHMYPSWENLKRDAAKDLDAAYIMCEYAHAMGNSMGNFQEYWDLMRSSKNMQGGFIWEWYNHGYPSHDEQGRFYWAYGGDLNGYNLPNDGNFCMDGLITPDQQYMPHTYIVKKVYQNILFEAKDLNKGLITVINDYKFIPLTSDSHDYKWVLLKNGEKFSEGSFSVELPADSRKDVKMFLPELKAEAGMEYYLQLFAYDKKGNKFIEPGFEVAKEEFPLNINQYFTAGSSRGSLTKNIQEETATITSGEMEYIFSLKEGRSLISMKSGGRNIFRELPRLNFWRAPVDNDFGSGEQYHLRLWDAAGHNVIYTYRGMEEKENGISFAYRAKLRGIEAFVDITYTVNNDGSLTTDLRLRQEMDGRLFYQGGLTTSNFYLGKILSLPQSVGRISLTGKVEGRGTTFEDTWMQLDCDINKIELYGYSYQNCKISGEFDEKKFNGNFSVNDPGLKLDFDGLIDLGGDYAEYDFTAQVAEARLQKLNLLHRDDSLCNLQFNVRANFIATHFDDLEGVINLTDLQYSEKGQTYRSGKTLLSTTALADGTRTLNLLSDFADIDLSGRLFFTRIPATIAIFVSNYLNTFRRTETPAQEDYSGQNFTYNIKLKDIDILTGLFLPWLKVSHNSVFRGNFDSFGRVFRIEGNVDTLSVKNIKLGKFYLNAQSFSDRIALHTGCRRVVIYEQKDNPSLTFGLDSFQLVSNIRHDSIHYSLSWDDDGPQDANIGRFKGFVSFTETPHIDVRLTHGAFRVNDSAYVVDPDNLVRVSPGGVHFEKIHIHSRYESLKIQGSLGADSSYALQARFANFNLANTNLLLNPYQIDLNGLVTGDLKLYRHSAKPVLQSGLRVEGFALNGQTLGRLTAQTRWDPSEESLYMDVSTEAFGKVAMYHPIRISGYYFPFEKNKMFDLQLETKAFNLKALAPFAGKVLSHLSGNVTARLKLGGTIARPELRGDMNFNHTEFRIKFLNTLYDFSGNVNFDPQKIYFENIELNDSLGNKAICSGRITHNYLRNAWFDIRIRPNDFILFNTLPGPKQILPWHRIRQRTDNRTGNSRPDESQCCGNHQQRN